MDNQRAIQIAELANRLMQLDATTLSEQQLQHRNDMIFKLKEEIKTLDEASLATMRDYFAGDENARDPMDITKQRLYFAKDKNAKPTMDKRFRSPEEYQAWLKQNKLKQISTAESAEQEIEEEKQRLDPKCWDGYKKQGTKIKGGVRVNNCVPESAEQGVAEAELDEKWSQKYKDSIDCNHPKGFSQKAHCASKNESIEESNGEYDDEAGMAESNLHTMSRAVAGLIKTIEDNDNLPEWAQEKIAKAEMMVTSVWDYLLSQKEQGVDPKVEGVAEGSQRVDSLVTDALRIMKGSEVSDAVRALTTVLGNREYNSRRGHYNFYIKQMIDMYNQQGVTEAKKPSPKLTPVNIKKTDPVSEEINTEAYERLQKVFAFKNYES